MAYAVADMLHIHMLREALTSGKEHQPCIYQRTNSKRIDMHGNLLQGMKPSVKLLALRTLVGTLPVTSMY